MSHHSMSVYVVEGEKAASFLHGQLTNHIKNLQEGEASYNLLLTQKGKIRSDMYVLREDGYYFLVIPDLFVGAVVGHLTALAPLSRVTLRQVDSSALLRSFSLQEEGALLEENAKTGISGYHNWIKAHVDEVFRIEHGLCLVGVDATEAHFPQEARLELALHFDKGCYLGQEIVARLQYRGHVNKKLVGLKLNQSAARGESLIENDKVSGSITSCIYSEKLKSHLALGYVPYDDASQVGKKFLFQSMGVAEIVELPLSVTLVS